MFFSSSFQSFKGFYDKLLWLGKITFLGLWYCKVGFVGCQETDFTHHHILSHIGGEVGSIPPYPTFIPPGLKKFVLSKVTNMYKIWLSQMGQNSIKGFVLWLARRARFLVFLVPNNICGTNTHDFPRTLSLGIIILYSETILLNIKVLWAQPKNGKMDLGACDYPDNCHLSYLPLSGI